MKDLHSLQPMSSYETPKYPTLDETKNDTKLLRKLPSRWKNNVAVIACVGMLGLGMLALTGCENIFNRGPHHGGDGGAPLYVAVPTELEVSFITTDKTS